MTIRDAILARTPDKPFITRESWKAECEGAFPIREAPKILPTNSTDCCVVSAYAARNPIRGWQPHKDDLVAEDLVPTD